MIKKLACLHAHYSNIAYIEQAFPASGRVQLIHYVDPGLMSRLSLGSGFDDMQAREKVAEQIEWIAGTKVDAILITCTNYIALLDEERLKSKAPIIKIDEPFFAAICSSDEPQTVLFTNPATVEGTMNRLHDFAASRGITLGQIDVQVVPNTFELIMQGKKEAYMDELTSSMRAFFEVLGNGAKLSVAQLSMVDAAHQVERELGVQIVNPLQTLAAAWSGNEPK
ncbi:aspartate/glutamate racemase family protein [Paenibacillus sp. OV219]|uniref:aspartate/glutamate racemase family protein n=1 Tax=Paenibacillus sp. OV219 TaxID=1884377 RepID=UPI0008B94849|nr:aspartate/glutamate racemase family protein [Paenibacillus sp. OV219]SEP02422.1 Asp/Glu/hydantoin racemase [Paenibacillus sp. OV219]